MQHTITLTLDGKTVTIEGLDSRPIRSVYPDEALAAEALRNAALRATEALSHFVMDGRLERYELSAIPRGPLPESDN